jgi:hypothetical protein
MSGGVVFLLQRDGFAQSRVGHAGEDGSGCASKQRCGAGRSTPQAPATRSQLDTWCTSVRKFTGYEKTAPGSGAVLIL